MFVPLQVVHEISMTTELSDQVDRTWTDRQNQFYNKLWILFRFQQIKVWTSSGAGSQQVHNVQVRTEVNQNLQL